MAVFARARGRPLYIVFSYSELVHSAGYQVSFAGRMVLEVGDLVLDFDNTVRFAGYESNGFPSPASRWRRQPLHDQSGESDT